MKDNWKSYLTISLLLGAFIAFNIFSKGPSDEEFEKSGIQIMTESNYQVLMSDVDRPVMVLFKSKTCNVCKVFAPRFIDFAKKNTDKARYLMADPDNVNFDHFNVLAYPTTRLYYQGKIVDELVGNGSLAPFQKHLEEIK